MKQHRITIGSLVVSNDLPLTLIAGPCAIESRNHAIEICHALSEITGHLGLGFIYKSSFDKANRTSLSSGRGVGMREGLAILADVRETVGCPVLTDVHAPEQCREAAKAVDVLQIPALLCRQTDLLIAAARTGRPVNIKKGQFLAPWDMEHVADKLVQSGNRDVLLCERGASFGYNTLVSDMRALPILAKTGFPVVFDATHSVQQPGGRGSTSGGQRDFVEILARAAVAVGVAGIFIETHHDPDKAPSDGPNMVPLQLMPRLLETLLAFDHLAKNVPAQGKYSSPKSGQRPEKGEGSPAR
ncbi:3-deoxy-8-phosphooctulonate synthase [Mesorhizobium sp. M5C.F.Cr.IN.023.01.1.1]|uniref:3-deoxy-8-phosphooctulonate synthase n=1 Tax=Mesorhizobium sp. M5C.F.Cr.IN.023.01.1.1 TaxID=2496768 RepID=UPI000FCA3F5F|nr:3-deoxy-8-phosphooctulonate synthase [Mesorhizobium sp. M5C.F.Cr.IN.023.01.1.1]RUV68579.1 3-deoxy-8-phosphooctulonate synthase [Mesorhizobium sp. M5C.F.Cr.IN.023.01.1.1]